MFVSFQIFTSQKYLPGHGTKLYKCFFLGNKKYNCLMQPTIISKCQNTQVLKQKNLALLKQDSKLLYSTHHEPLALFGCHKIWALGWAPAFKSPSTGIYYSKDMCCVQRGDKKASKYKSTILIIYACGFIWPP